MDGEHTDNHKTVIFWGAGATASLGFRTTKQQAIFIKNLVMDDVVDAAGLVDGHLPLESRIKNALGECAVEPWTLVLGDLINILGDDEANERSIYPITIDQLSAMRRNMKEGTCDGWLRERIMALRLIYDWPALKAVVRISPGVNSDNFLINDVFNLLDMHTPVGHGFRSDDGVFLTAGRLIGAKATLKMLLQVAFWVDYQQCLKEKRHVLELYYQFASVIARQSQKDSLVLSDEIQIDHPEFYNNKISFVSLNYDPVLLWTQFLANREANSIGSAPAIGSPAVPLNIFHAFGHMIPARRIGKGDRSWPWYPLNEAVAQRFNEPGSMSSSRVRLTKLLYPHGNLCWRECPDCGKLSAYHGDEWSRHAPGIFPPPPLMKFVTSDNLEGLEEQERVARSRGRVDARACLHCGTLTSAHNTQTVMQSSFKATPPSFIEEIQRDLRVTVMRADHIVFMGYSLPPDDVTYRAIFAARMQRSEQQGGVKRNVYCTIIDRLDKFPGWHGPEAIKKWPEQLPAVVKAACDIFGPNHVRLFGGGCPDVFRDADGHVTEASLDRLTIWHNTPKQ